MKKVICLFLIVWLPIFMGSAWAMRAQMAMDAQTQPAQAQQSSMADMPHCTMQTNQKTAQTNQKNSPQHEKCTTCGLCAMANAASFNSAPQFYLPSRASSAPQALLVAFSSRALPPSIKPPILN